MKKMKYTANGDLIEYEVYSLVDFYDPILKTKTTPWDFNTRTVKDAEYVAYSMAETLQRNGGLGLSANQVGLSDRVCAVNMGDKIWVMFNPEIIERGLTRSTYNEGCLSYPGLYLKIERSFHVKVRFQAIGGQQVEQGFDGMTATVLQHEIDHLDGKLFTEHVHPLHFEKAKRKVKTNLKKMEAFAKYAEKECLTGAVEAPAQEVKVVSY